MCGILSASLVLAFAPGVTAFAQEEASSEVETPSEVSYEDGVYAVDELVSSYATLGLPAGIALKPPTVTFNGDVVSFTLTTSKGQFDRMLLKKKSEIEETDEGVWGTPIYTDPSNPVYDPVTKTGIDGYTFKFTLAKEDFLKGMGVTPEANVDAGIPFALRYRSDYVNNNGESTYANQWSGSKDQYLGFSGLTYSGAVPNIADCVITASKLVYTGKSQRPVVTVCDSDGVAITEGIDYTLEYDGNSVNAGTCQATVKGIAAYTGTTFFTYTISKAKQNVKVIASTKTLKAKKLKKKKLTVKPLTVKGNSGKVTYKKVSVNKLAGKFKVNSKTGKITVAKGVKKGKYTVKVKVSAAADANHLAFSKTVKSVIKVS